MNALFPIKLFVIVWLIVVLAIASIAAKETVPKGDEIQLAKRVEAEQPRQKGEPSIEDSWSRLREGSKITDEIGEFQTAADRFHFYLQNDKRPIRVLENLSLERVART